MKNKLNIYIQKLLMKVIDYIKRKLVTSISNDIFENIKKERSNWQKIVDIWKQKYEIEEKKNWELTMQKTWVEFIWGDVETGWVWQDPIDYYSELTIGQEIIQFVGNNLDERKEFVIDNFNGFKGGDNNVLSFNVIEKQSK